MKAIGILFTGVFLLISIMSNSNLSRMEAFFIRKSLNDDGVKHLFHSKDGECFPVLINGTPTDHLQIGYSKHCDIEIDQVEITQSDSNEYYALLIYRINNRYQIIETFKSNDLLNWETQSRTVKVQ